MKALVTDIAELFSGIYANTSISKGKAVYYLQVRHWDNDRKWRCAIQPELCLDKKFENNYLKVDDILVVTKGIAYFALLYDGCYAPAIASSVFTVLRINDKTTVLPAYLQWILNHPVTSRKLTAAAKGSSMRLITQDVIGGMEVPMPSLEHQQTIIKAEDLRQAAAQLRSRINKLDETLFNYRLLQTANSQ